MKLVKNKKLTTKQIVKSKNIHQAGKEAYHRWVKHHTQLVDFDYYNKPLLKGI